MVFEFALNEKISSVDPLEEELKSFLLSQATAIN
jgi:hypothetical protein